MSTHLCELGFSSLLQIKTNQCSILEAENDLCCVFPGTPPHISELAKKK